MSGRRFSGRVHQQGVSLVEVMIAILVMGVGMLGFALLQTMNVRFTQSANHRTQATNLAYDMLDQMRVNRLAAAQYAGNYTASTDLDDCEPDDAVGATAFANVWQCRLGAALGGGASATVSYDDGEATVAITWGDERWNDEDGDGAVSAAEKNQTFEVGSRL